MSLSQQPLVSQMESKCLSLRWAFDCLAWIPSKEQFTGALSRIPQEEWSEILSYMFKRDVKFTLIGRLMFRSAASIATGQVNKCIQLSRTKKGKPYIVMPIVKETFDLNVSHHGRYSVLACEASNKVGVDIMRVEYPRGRNVPEYFDLMRKQFSSNEWSFIGNPSSDHPYTCMSRFMRLWSLKEAYVKAEGFGITTDLRLIDFRCRTHSPETSDSVLVDTELYIEGRNMDKWVFHESKLPHDHHLAVAIEKMHPDTTIVPRPFDTIDLEFLINQLEPLIDSAHPGLEDAWKSFASKSESNEATPSVEVTQ